MTIVASEYKFVYQPQWRNRQQLVQISEPQIKLQQYLFYEQFMKRDIPVILKHARVF